MLGLPDWQLLRSLASLDARVLDATLAAAALFALWGALVGWRRPGP